MTERLNMIRDLTPQLRIRVTRNRDRVCIIVRHGDQTQRRCMSLAQWERMTEREASRMTHELVKAS